jgi:hypothetical protein
MDNFAKYGLIGGLGAGAAGGLFGGGSNPYDAASKYFNQIPGQLHQSYDPYIQAGQRALPQLQSQYGQLLNDPGGKMNQIGGSFHQSPGFQFAVDQATGAANRAGAAGGMLGSPMEQQNLAHTVNGLANQDYYNYLSHALSLYGSGLEGTQDLYKTGYDASSNLGTNLASTLAQQGGWAAQGQASQNQQRGSSLTDLGSMIGMISSFGGL